MNCLSIAILRAFAERSLSWEPAIGHLPCTCFKNECLGQHPWRAQCVALLEVTAMWIRRPSGSSTSWRFIRDTHYGYANSSSAYSLPCRDRHITAVVVEGACLLHFMLRFQLIHRWHCTQFYQIYREAIMDLHSMEKKVQTAIIQKSPIKKPGRFWSTLKYFVWTSNQSIIPMTFNYPTTELLHKTIEKYHHNFVVLPKKMGAEKIQQLKKSRPPPA